MSALSMSHTYGNILSVQQLTHSFNPPGPEERKTTQRKKEVKNKTANKKGVEGVKEEKWFYRTF